MSKETVTVYWAPALSPSVSALSILYRTPTPVLNRLRQTQVKSVQGTFFSCPATTSLFKNVYEICLPIDIEYELTEEDKADDVLPGSGRDLLNNMGPVSLLKNRKTNLENHFAFGIGGFGWVFFSDEPLIARFSAPYFPPSAPAEGTVLAAGEFDIGSWYRPMNFEYHVPVTAEKLTFKAEEPIGYIEFKTEKEIIFKRYRVTPVLHSFIEEAMSVTRYSSFWGKKKYLSLLKRYNIFREANMHKQVLNEIKKNVIE